MKNKPHAYDIHIVPDPHDESHAQNITDQIPVGNTTLV